MYAKNNLVNVRMVAAVLITAITLTLIAALLPNVVAQASTPASTFRSQLVQGAAADKFAAYPEGALGSAVASHALTATPIAPPAPPKTTTARRTSSGTATSTASSSGDAQSILNGLIARYPILAGTTVEYGDAKGSQAIAYYKSGRIVISPDHTASLTRILNHEVWHIIDWRDNGVIDWGENVPPQ